MVLENIRKKNFSTFPWLDFIWIENASVGKFDQHQRPTRFENGGGIRVWTDKYGTILYSPYQKEMKKILLYLFTVLLMCYWLLYNIYKLVI